MTAPADPGGAPFTGTASEHRAHNQAYWDERVALHLASDLYDVDRFRARRDTLRPFEVTEVGDVTGRRLAHPQCHFGLDTLSWAARGAQVSGLDFSPAAIAAARALAAECDLPARFVVADVYDAPAVLGAGAYDIVYTGFGALVWLDDLTRWAAAMAALLTPGGFLYLAEFHPFAGILDETDGRCVTEDYFAGGPRRWESTGSYADARAVTTANITVQRDHTLGEIVSAVAGAGLRVEFLHEHPVTLFARTAALRRGPDRLFRPPAGAPRVPLTYTLRAAKPPL
ncbi:Methyltransferase family protein [Frankia canadensis]|uniref:Methyltransferase family protein n=1 Tax=Frankia canadensis TaxID=1836972 RepID=A0A2I2KSV9_9ACTN|nr:class I SAM-dependent methyltransferase [Frankia canadensis]SNQ48730.1 Methyltransferase family protein [Frankia canadensis]SOU56020.1 Methyltransferase family protein [Frankia canadensis]